jgi:hypothetical protein
MGPRQSWPEATTTNTVVRGETNLKLEAQKIKDFTRGQKDWPKWKSPTKCAFSGNGYERFLEDLEYATANERLNEVVYSQLAAATVEGIAPARIFHFRAVSIMTESIPPQKINLPIKFPIYSCLSQEASQR